MEEKGPDSISSLPEDILRRVVSFVPLKEAARACILSNTWRALLAPFHVSLDIGWNEVGSDRGKAGVAQAVGIFIMSYNSPEIRKISLGYSGCRDGSLKTKDKLIISACKGVEKELLLEFFERETVVKSNFSLKLRMPLQDHCKHPKEMANFASLRTLHLRSVTGVAEGIVAALFSSCRLLESLKMEKCIGLERLEIKAGDSLKSFSVTNCPEMASISVSAPNLRSFWYQGALPCIHLETSPTLVDAVLDMRDGPGINEFDCEELLSLLESLKDVEILTLSGWLLEWLCSAGVVFRMLQFGFNNLKEFRWKESAMDTAKRDSMAYFLDICPSLERLFIDIDPRRISVTCPIFHLFWHEPRFWMDHSAAKSSHPQHESLKIVEVRGFTNRDEELLTMDVLLKKTVSLKSMVVTSPEEDNRSWFLVKVPGGQLKQTSESFKFVSFLDAKKDYFFGFIEAAVQKNSH